jgi:hypothetical protein
MMPSPPSQSGIGRALRFGRLSSGTFGNRSKNGRPTKGGLNSKLHAVCDGAGRAVIFLLTGGQMSDRKGAALICPMLPDVETLIAEKGYDSDYVPCPGGGLAEGD